ncbi:MAG TPA: transcriptional regulator FeaR [Candidatus Acidoferrum sp.]|nr:transcriptional regulator FeaR [Candidatus Acidoferrum sp.]
MSQAFSTDLIPVSDRLDAWLQNARQICGDCSFQFHKRFPFHGSIERRKIAGLELTLFSSSALSFNKFPPSHLPPENCACIVITQLQGVRQYRQAGKVAVLGKGDTTLIDSTLPWSSDCSGDCARLYLRIPQLLIESRLRGVKVPTASRICGARGLGTTLFHLATSLYQQAEALTPEEGAAAIEAYLKILSACIEPAVAALGRVRSRKESAEHVLEYINQHLTEGTLAPGQIAEGAGISVRHLHRLFARRGTSVSEWIRVQRLERCWKDLGDPRQRERSITEIAYFWGFNDSAHFSHSFKKHFGVSPRSYRLRHWVGSRDRQAREEEVVYLDSQKIAGVRPS